MTCVPLMLAELALLLAGLTLIALELLPSASIPLSVVAWVTLGLRHNGWRDVGLRRPEEWRGILAIAPIAAVAFQALDLFVIVPVLHRWTGRPIDLSPASALRGNVPLLLLWLGFSWTLAAFLEEILFRGYLSTRINDLLARG